MQRLRGILRTKHCHHNCTCPCLTSWKFHCVEFQITVSFCKPTIAFCALDPGRCSRQTMLSHGTVNLLSPRSPLRTAVSSRFPSCCLPLPVFCFPAGLASVGDHPGWKWKRAGSDCLPPEVRRNKCIKATDRRPWLLGDAARVHGWEMSC